MNLLAQENQVIPEIKPHSASSWEKCKMNCLYQDHSQIKKKHQSKLPIYFPSSSAGDQGNQARCPTNHVQVYEYGRHIALPVLFFHKRYIDQFTERKDIK